MTTHDPEPIEYMLGEPCEYLHGRSRHWLVRAVGLRPQDHHEE